MNHNWLLMLLYESCYIFSIICFRLRYILIHNLLKIHIKILYMLGYIKIYIIYMCHTGRCVLLKYT